MTRVASTLADNQTHFDSFREILLDMRFLPAGRIQAAIGSSKVVTANNCYVSGTIEDSYVDGEGSIMNRAAQAALTMRMGGGIGYDFSGLRPRGSLIKKLSSTSAGPVPFMEIFDAVCRATCSSGHRRGAQMGVLRVDHPDIEEFVRAKQNSTYLTGFNISVAITDEFMQAVLDDRSFSLRWGGHNHRDIRAVDLWNTIMRSNYDWAEPGVLFIDTINKRNNLFYCETVAATNPCGEQPLPPFGACLLGSFNLVKYLTRKSPEHKWTFNWTQFLFDIPQVVRAMDNVVDMARYPLFEQEKEAVGKRRMGLGVTGVANCIEALNAPYGSPVFISLLDKILDTLKNEAYKASALLAKVKGPFPRYNGPKFLQSEFVGELEDETWELIEEHGVRNSHLLSIAPTGTISLTADNVSSSIEPVFAYEQKRTVIEERGPVEINLQDYGYRFLNVKGRTAAECNVGDHLAVLATASSHVDSAVSKTCNLPMGYLFDSFKEVYIQAWQARCKGCTTYRAGCKREAVLISSDNIPSAACILDPATGRQNCE